LRRRKSPPLSFPTRESTLRCDPFKLIPSSKLSLRISIRFCLSWGPFLTLPLAPRGEICPLGGMFTPLFTPRGEHSLQFRRIEGRTENCTPKG
jgi:hypothetical protein